MRQRPRVTTRCVADRYSGAGERIVEFSGRGLGGLISFRDCPDGTLRIDVYRADLGVVVNVGPDARVIGGKAARQRD